MSGKREKPEEIVSKLRQVEVLQGQGMRIADAVRQIWLNDGSCVRLRPERPDHVWSYDFVQDRTHDGRAYRTLNIIDEYTRDPSFPEPIRAALFEEDGAAYLVRNRREG